MATDLMDLTTVAQDNVLSVIKLSQTAVLEGVRTWADAMEKVTPDLPTASMPGMDMLPSIGDGVSMTFGFAQKLLDTQQEFAEAIVAAMTPAAKPIKK